ncbi:MAG: hypothetical protein ACYC9J_06690 [Sulfuricaulis sp.]
MNWPIAPLVWVAAAAYLIGEMARLPVGTAVAALLLILTLLMSAGSWITKRSGKLAVAVGGLSVGLLLYHGNVGGALSKTGSYVGVVVLLFCVSFIKLPVKQMALETTVNGLLGAVRRRHRIATVMLSSTLLAPLLNLGTVALLGTLLHNKSQPPVSVPRAVTRGIGAAMLWSPTFAPTALIMMQFPDVPWTHTLPLAIPLVIVALVMSLPDRGEVDVKQDKEPKPPAAQATLARAVALVTLIAGAMLVSRAWIGMSISAAVSLGGILGVFLWYLIFGWESPLDIHTALRDHTESTWRQMSAEAALFIASGLLASVLQEPYWSNILSPLSAWFNTSSWFSWGAIMLGVPLLTVAGVHPVVPYTVLVHQVTAAGLGVGQTTLYMVWAVVWMLSLLLSPVSALNLSASVSFGVSPWRVGMVANWSYGLVFGVIAMVILRQWG